MNPLSVLYGAVSGVRNTLFDRGLLKPQRLKGPVVSVGNISAGGSGKTPFVIMLGELLKSRGIPFDVLSRGYGRHTTGVREVDPSGSAENYGDEPILIARRLGVPVIVGESRFAAGRYSEKHWGPRLHLLDDGFQHRALHRDFDIVLASSVDATDKLLPIGRLREPWTALSRADAIVLTNEAPASIPLPADKQIWQVRRSVQISSSPLRPIAFCGIARPQRFVDDLNAAGIRPAMKFFFDDHHSYSEEDIRKLLELKQKNSAGGFITTEKDAVNLGSLARSLEPLSVAQVVMELIDSDQALGSLLQQINGPAV
jgi:tetraacyldisaccharide 4'-kinase